jgi:uncharacterized membrane protein YidH (DUF202 family)
MERNRASEIALNPAAACQALEEAAHHCPVAVQRNPYVASGLLALENPTGAARLALRSRFVLAERRLGSALKTLFPRKTLALLFAEEAASRPRYQADKGPALAWFWTAIALYQAGKIDAESFEARTSRIEEIVLQHDIPHEDPQRTYLLALYFLACGVLALAASIRPRQLPRRIRSKALYCTSVALLRFAEFRAGLPARALTQADYARDEDPSPRLLEERERQLRALRT